MSPGSFGPRLRQKGTGGTVAVPNAQSNWTYVGHAADCVVPMELQLGDIKGAFPEAGALPQKFRPLFAKQPPGGIPGVPKDAVLEVLGNVYGQNDAPLSWHRTFDHEALSIGWERSKFDPWVYFLRDQCKLVG